MRWFFPRIFTAGGGGGGGTGSNLPDPVTVAHGGTGLTTLPSGQLLKGAGAGNVAGADLTGDVTTSGALATTIAAGSVTLAKQANFAASSFRGNNTGSPATGIDMTVAQAKTLLALAFTDITGTTSAGQEPAHTGDVTNSAGSLALAIASGAVTAAKLAVGAVDVSTTVVTGTLAAGRFPALTGDVTTSAGALATTIAAGAVTLAKQANLAANTIQGNNTGSGATPLALTRAQVWAMLSTQAGAAVDMNAQNLTNVLDPTSAQHAATKNYVDKGIPTSAALTDAATVTYAVGANRLNTLLATSGVGNTRALGDPTGMTAGVTYQLVYTQDVTGGRALTISGTGLKLAAAVGTGTTVPVDTTASSVSLILIAVVSAQAYIMSVEKVV